MGTPPDLQLPRPPGWPPWAIATSVALHLAMIAALLSSHVPYGRRVGPHQLISLATPTSQPSRAVQAMPPASASRASGPAVVESPTAASVAAEPAPARSEREVADSAPSSPTAAAGRGGPFPSLGLGPLWDRRVPSPLTYIRSHAWLTDSAVKAIIDHYLDSLAALPGGGRVLPPSWKGTIGGKEYGLDAQWITVAGVKIPSLLLALIPLPNGGNESKALDKGAWMRATDYQFQQPRQEISADQREQIEAIRKRKAGEAELNRKQREAPE